jgi:hypothetical protein
MLVICTLLSMTRQVRGPKIKTHLNVVVEDEMCSTVLSQQAECILIGKVLKLQPIKRKETT